MKSGIHLHLRFVVSWLVVTLSLGPAPARAEPPVAAFAEGSWIAPVQDRSTQENQDQDEEQEGPKAYSDVITEEAETDEGLFDVHRVDETLYFEIPDSLLGRDMLLVSRIGKVPVGFPGFSPAGVKTGEQVLRWERRADKILLRTISYSNVADDTLAISISVEANNFGPIIAAFDIEAEAPDSASVVNTALRAWIPTGASSTTPAAFRSTSTFAIR